MMRIHILSLISVLTITLNLSFSFDSFSFNVPQKVLVALVLSYNYYHKVSSCSVFQSSLSIISIFLYYSMHFFYIILPISLKFLDNYWTYQYKWIHLLRILPCSCNYDARGSFCNMHFRCNYDVRCYYIHWCLKKCIDAINISKLIVAIIICTAVMIGTNTFINIYIETKLFVKSVNSVWKYMHLNVV